MHTPTGRPELSCGPAGPAVRYQMQPTLGQVEAALKQANINL